MQITKYFLLLAICSIATTFAASDPKGYVIDGTKIIMWRVTCANGDWVDFNTQDLAKSGGASRCKEMGSSFVDAKQRPGSPSSKWTKEMIPPKADPALNMIRPISKTRDN